MPVLLKLSRLLAGVAAVLVVINFLPSISHADPQSLKREFRSAFRCKANCNSDHSRLVNEVVALAGGPLFSGREDAHVRDSQAACQSAIASAATSYVVRRIDLTERGFPPEKADDKASKELERIVNSCNVNVSDVNGMLIPKVGKSCSAYLGPLGSSIDVDGLRNCLRRNLDLYADYLSY